MVRTRLLVFEILKDVCLVRAIDLSEMLIALRIYSLVTDRVLYQIDSGTFIGFYPNTLTPICLILVPRILLQERRAVFWSAMKRFAFAWLPLDKFEYAHNSCTCEKVYCCASSALECCLVEDSDVDCGFFDCTLVGLEEGGVERYGMVWYGMVWSGMSVGVDSGC